MSSSALRRFGVPAAFIVMLLAARGAEAACTNPTANAGSLIFNTTYNIMQYCNGTDWINWGSGGSGGGGSTSTMVTNWPDGIYCSGSAGAAILYHSMTGSTGTHFYQYADGQGTWIELRFNSSGTYLSDNNSTSGLNSYYTSCPSKSISQLYAAGQAFNFIGGGSGSSQWTTSGSNLTFTSGNVGIGTTTPGALLALGAGNVLLTPAAGTTNGGLMWQSAGAWQIQSDASSFLRVITNNLEAIRINSSANVGIGTTSPSQKLTVAGTIESTTGGVKFPDGSTQTTAASGSIPTGAVMAFDLASCPSGWSEYTAARGRFLRGIDNGAGIDPDGTRSPGGLQSDMLKSHTHTQQTADNGTTTSGVEPKGVNNSTGLGSSGRDTLATGGRRNTSRKRRRVVLPKELAPPAFYLPSIA